MTVTLRDVVSYLCDHYPRPGQLSNARLTKMVYLADWKSAIERGEQLTDLSWEFSYYGPYVPDVVRLARSDDGFEVEEGKNQLGERRELVRRAPGAVEDEKYASLSPEDKGLLEFVIGSVEDKSFTEFIKLVYSTYPIVTQERHSELDLVRLAREYAEAAPLLGS